MVNLQTLTNPRTERLAKDMICHCPPNGYLSMVQPLPSPLPLPVLRICGLLMEDLPLSNDDLCWKYQM